MKGWRLFFLSFLICLPALMVIGIGGYLIAANVPAAIRREPSRIGREYRAVAEELAAHPERATYAGSRQKGWVQRGKIGGVPWGYTVADARVTVWYATETKQCRAVEIDAIRSFPHAAVFYGGGAVVAVVLLVLSALLVVYFVRYMRARDDFLAATAHDLTTPLVGMRMMIGRDDGEAKKLNERMLLIVSNIKDFLRLGGKRRKPELKPVDIVALCQEAYQLFAADYEDSEGGEVRFETGSDGGEGVALRVCADETMTLQILWNLFGNDLKYAAPYGKVAVRFVREGAWVRVEFVDEGQGMTPRQMRKAFDRYYRAQTVLQSGKGGFGIGLCTAREFARAMGGDLTVRANQPQGCVFALSLPCVA